MGETEGGREQRSRLLEALNSFSVAQTELGRAFARAHGLHPTDASAILQIIAAEDRGHPLTPARLAEAIPLTSGATSILLNRLEAAGHIARTRESSDRRVVTLRSTASIHAAADAYYRPVGDQLASALDDVPIDDLARLEQIVTTIRFRLLTILDERDAAPAPPDSQPG